MTSKAREVLADCEVALSLLEEEKENSHWRVHWAAAVALIRAVGHVLYKVDGQDPTIRKVSQEAFKEWEGDSEKHRIFRDFIERERNNLLKEYRTDVHPNSEISVALEFFATPVAGGDPVKLRHVGKLEESIYRPMLDGPWEGDDSRDVFGAAVEWWKEQLELIDAKVELRKAKKPPLGKRSC